MLPSGVINDEKYIMPPGGNTYACVVMAAAGDENIGDSLQKVLNLSRETDIQQQDPIATQHEHLITEIEESTEGHLSTALR